jgi:hypothetical protein
MMRQAHLGRMQALSLTALFHSHSMWNLRGTARALNLCYRLLSFHLCFRSHVFLFVAYHLGMRPELQVVVVWGGYFYLGMDCCEGGMTEW